MTAPDRRIVAPTNPACSALSIAASPTAALAELHRVHRIEQAFLLREAAWISVARTRRGRLYSIVGRSQHRDRSLRTGAWRDACREEIECARSDGAIVHP